MFGCGPAPIATIIVSPMAREMASTNEATMPETARRARRSGSTTWNFDAPSP